MAPRKLRQKATTTARTEVTTCPRPDCPNPTLHIAKSGAKYHCIGCWRRFTRSGRIRAAQQKPPPKRWLLEFSPERLNGPPPKLVEVKLTIRLCFRPARSGPSTPTPVSIATENTDSLPVTSIATENDESFAAISVWATSSEEDEDDEVMSTARYDGATATAPLSSTADSRYTAGPSRRSWSPSTPDSQDVEGFPDFSFQDVDFSIHSSTARYPAREAAALLSSTEDSRYAARPSGRSRYPSIATPVIDDIPDVNFPHSNFSLPMTTVRDEDCESTGSLPDEVIPVGPSIVRALKLTHFGRKFAVCGGRTTRIVRALKLTHFGSKFAVCCGRTTGIRTGVMMRV